MIQLDEVFKFYRTDGHVKIVLDHATTVFQSGRSYGLLGVNGAGKSTTLRMIAGTEARRRRCELSHLIADVRQPQHYGGL
jgi:ABC-type multidrug transport system ATPase subunit